jgi:hypothetical protein
MAARGSVLLLGNLPWVTNATVAGINGTNLPKKENFQGFRGIEARTGKSNFDISEWMLIQLLIALRGRHGNIAMLCKTATARKLLRFGWKNDLRLTEASLFRIDAKKHFAAAVDACLLCITTGATGPSEAVVFESLSAELPATTFGMVGRNLVADLNAYRRHKQFEGTCPYQWRSGVKHDCASVMELRPTDACPLENKFGECVDIEQDHLFPLLKCSDLANGRTEPERLVIVTQQRVGQDTMAIAKNAPRTWRYLESHRDLFNARKSSIYSAQIPFALFGIGDYSFAPWKVAVSGLHRSARFALVGPVDNKPVLFDDTCYFLSFDSEDEARVVVDILNSRPCKEFLACLSFTDSKRPITVELLRRLNLQALAQESGLLDKWEESRAAAFRAAEPLCAQAQFLMER